MRYLLGWLFHQNKFPVKLLGPKSVYSLATCVLLFNRCVFLVLFISSTSHPHPLCRSRRSQIFFKIGLPRNFANFTGNHRCFFYRKPPVAPSIYFAFHESFFFYFCLAALPLLPYGAVTFFVSRNTFVFLSLLLHHYYHNSRMTHQDCCNHYDLLYCHFHDSYMY